MSAFNVALDVDIINCPSLKGRTFNDQCKHSWSYVLHKRLFHFSNSIKFQSFFIVILIGQSLNNCQYIATAMPLLLMQISLVIWGPEIGKKNIWNFIELLRNCYWNGQWAPGLSTVSLYSCQLYGDTGTQSITWIWLDAGRWFVSFVALVTDKTKFSYWIYIWSHL